MPEERVQRRLAAILAADVVGYSRLIRVDEEGTLARLRALRSEIIDPKIAKHNGRIVKLMGDGMLAEFASVVDAVRNAIEVQQSVTEREASVSEDRRIVFRVGINLGDVVVDGDDIHGDGVNVAARLEGMANPGGICVSGAVHDQVRDRIDVAFEDLGEQQIKNIDRPIRAWQWSPSASATAHEATAKAKPSQRTDTPAIAVLPFDNMSGDPAQEYFSDGITEEIITALSRIRWFLVIARNTTFTFKGLAVDVKTVAKELGVSYVLEGSVRKAADQVRVTVQLIDGTTGNHLWAERYDRSLTDIFALQDEIAENVVGAAEPEIAQAELDRRRSKKPENMHAWDIYLRGKSQIQLDSRESVADGIRQLRTAIDMEPELARAHAMLATAYGRQLILGYAEDRRLAQELSMQAGSRAVALDRNDADCHVGLAMGLRAAREFDEAISALKTAIELNPSHAFAHSTLGVLLGISGRAEDAMEHHRAALRLSPRDPDLATFLGRYANSCVHARQYEEAVELGKRAIRHSGGYPWLIFLETATALSHLGRVQEARGIVDRMKEVRPDATIETVRNSLVFSRPQDEEHYLDGLRKAGMPE